MILFFFFWQGFESELPKIWFSQNFSIQNRKLAFTNTTENYLTFFAFNIESSKGKTFKSWIQNPYTNISLKKILILFIYIFRFWKRHEIFLFLVSNRNQNTKFWLSRFGLKNHFRCFSRHRWLLLKLDFDLKNHEKLCQNGSQSCQESTVGAFFFYSNLKI